MTLKSLHRDRRGQSAVEMLFVFPLLFMLFTFMFEMGYLLYDWAVINYHTSTIAVSSATTGQFSNTIRLRLVQNLHDWTVNGKGYTYNADISSAPVTTDKNTVYIYGSDENTAVQRGQYIFVNVDYPWHFKFFLIDALAGWIVNEQDMRLHVNAAFPSEVFYE